MQSGQFWGVFWVLISKFLLELLESSGHRTNSLHIAQSVILLRCQLLNVNTIIINCILEQEQKIFHFYETKKFKFWSTRSTKKRMSSQSSSNDDTESAKDDVTDEDVSDSGCSFGDWCKTFWIRTGYSIAYFIFYTIYGLLCFCLMALLSIEFLISA